MKIRNPLPPTYLLIAILIMLALHFLLPVMAIVPFAWRFAGFVPLIPGVWLNLSADKAFKQRNTTVKPFEESSALVTDGAFRISRNPMYLGFVLILVGVGLFMGSLTPFFVVPVFAVAMDVIFIRIEERMLAEEFREDWTRYKQQVRRWI